MTDEARAAVFARVFGEPVEVVRDEDPRTLAVDVAVHAPGFADRSFYTLVTHGMSDVAMPIPDGVEASSRTELVLYVDQPGPTFVRLLQTIAKIPHEADHWLGAGHTIPNGEPPAPLFPGSALDTVLVLESVVSPERELKSHVEISGSPLELLWVVPITAAECGLKVEEGVGALLNLFNERQLSFVLDPGRESLV